MHVRLVLDAQNQVVFIAAKPADEDAAPGLEQAVKGEVAKVDVTNQRFWVTVKGVAMVPLKLDPQVLAVSAKRVGSSQKAK